MTQTLTANTARANLSTALVAGLSQPFAIKPFPRIAAGETFDVELYLIENGAYDTRSGATGYTPRIKITLDDTTPQDGTFTISDGVETTAALDHDTLASEVETALNALNDNTGPFGDKVLVDKFGNGAFSIVFDSVGNKSPLVADVAGIRPASSATVSAIVDGSASRREEQIIKVSADPLVSVAAGVEITNGWTVTIDATGESFLRAVTVAQGAISANYSIELVADSGAVDVVARGPVILTPGA